MAWRAIDSEIWMEEDFCLNSPMLRLFQLGIMNLVNDAGVMTANPRFLRSKIFVADDIPSEQIESYLSELQSKKFITLFEENGKPYLKLAERWVGRRWGIVDPDDYGYNWHGLSAATRRRDDYRCQDCGRTNCRLNAHHIVPVGSGGRNELENLITLCAVCHRKAHKKVK